MRKNSKVLVTVAMVMASVYMIGCGANSGVTGNENVIEEADKALSGEATEETTKEQIDIQFIGEGQAYNIDEKCSVLKTYGEYNVQADVNDVYSLLMRDNYEAIELRTHSVEPTDATNSENGKYDAIDVVNVKVAFADDFGVMSQNVTKDVIVARDAASGKWEITGETCKKWDVKYKKLGGTSWKMTTKDGDVYLRLRDTIEFFTTQPGNKNSKENKTEFSTTILGAIYMNVDGENVLKRIHVTSGTLSEDGDIVLNIEYPHTEENGIEINLNDFEKIEREELPFTEEEFRETSDQLG